MAKQKVINWLDKYDVVGIIPGFIYLPEAGEIDISKADIPLETMDKIFNSKCPFIILKVNADDSAVINP